LFGGYGSDGATSDIWLYSISANTWQLVYGDDAAAESDAPIARNGSALFSDKNGNIAIFGGTVYEEKRTAILGDTFVIYACSFDETCPSAKPSIQNEEVDEFPHTLKSRAVDAAATTGALTSSTTGRQATNGTTGMTTGTTSSGSSTSCTADSTVTCSGGNSNSVNTTAVSCTVASALNTSCSNVNTTVVSSRKKAATTTFQLLISVFYPNFAAISKATGSSTTNITAQVLLIENAVLIATNGTALRAVLAADNTTVTGVSVVATTTTVYPTTYGATTQMSTGFTIAPPRQVLMVTTLLGFACLWILSL